MQGKELVPYGYHRGSKNTPAERYKRLSSLRESYLSAAEQNASLTLPYILTRTEQSSVRETLPKPYNSIGAISVRNLSGMLTTALYPTTQSFQLVVPSEILDSIEDTQEGKAQADELQTRLLKDEQEIQKQIESNHWRATTYTVLMHLLITGNVCEQILPDNSIRIFPVDSYVCVRNNVGDLVELITCESYTEDTLPDGLRDLAGIAPRGQGGAMPASAYSEKLKLYTHIILDGESGTYMSKQYLGDKHIEEQDTEFDFGLLPYNVLYYDLVIGESYGRGLVESVVSDMVAVDKLTQALLEATAIGSKTVFLVDPALGTRDLHKKLSSSKNGDVLQGSKDSVSTVAVDKRLSLSEISAEIGRLTQSISRTFLNTSAAVRDSERTTAEEVRLQRNELENGLGGFYSRMTDDMLLPRIKWLMYRMRLDEKISPDFDPEVLTGAEALSREQRYIAATTAIRDISQMPPEYAIYIDPKVLLGEILRGLNLPNAVRTEDEVSKIRSEQIQAQAASAFLDSAATGAGNAITQPPPSEQT